MPFNHFVIITDLVCGNSLTKILGGIVEKTFV